MCMNVFVCLRVCARTCIYLCVYGYVNDSSKCYVKLIPHFMGFVDDDTQPTLREINYTRAD